MTGICLDRILKAHTDSRIEVHAIDYRLLWKLFLVGIFIAGLQRS